MSYLSLYANGLRQPFPQEDRGGYQCRRPTGRDDDMPHCLPPILQNLTSERKAMGRIGHFSSRRPLLSLTAEQEGSLPDPFSRSTGIMLPAPSPHLYNRRPDQNEQADPLIIEDSYLTAAPSFTEEFRRIYQDRHNYLKPRDARDPGGQEVSTRPAPMTWEARRMPTKNQQFEHSRAAGGPEALHQASIGLVGADLATKRNKTGQLVTGQVNQGLQALTNRGVQLGDYEGRLHQGNILASQRDSWNQYNGVQTAGGPEHQGRQQTYTYDPANADGAAMRPQTRQVHDAQTSESGGAETLTTSLYRQEGVLDGRRGSDNRDVYHGHALEGFFTGQDWAADRFASRRMQLFDVRPENRSSTIEINHSTLPTSFERYTPGNAENRTTDRLPTGEDAFRGLDPGLLYGTQLAHPTDLTEASFFSQQQARHSLF